MSFVFFPNHANEIISALNLSFIPFYVKNCFFEVMTFSYVFFILAQARVLVSVIVFRKNIPFLESIYYFFLLFLYSFDFFPQLLPTSFVHRICCYNIGKFMGLLLEESFYLPLNVIFSLSIRYWWIRQHLLYFS